MNINDKVWVRLTDAGVKVWMAAFYRDAGFHAPVPPETLIWSCFQLHELMRYFGDGLVMSGPPLFVDNEIATKKPEGDGCFTPPKAPVVTPALPPDGRLTRTEIFLRLVDSFCRQPGGFTRGASGQYSNHNVFTDLHNQALATHELWGGK